MRNVFADADELSYCSSYVSCMTQISRFFSVVMYRTSFSQSDEQYHHLYQKNRLFNQEFVHLVQDTKIFSSPHAAEFIFNGLFAMVSSYTSTNTIVNPYSVEVLLDILEYVNPELGLGVLDKIIEYTDNTHHGYARLSESKIILLIIVKINRLVMDKSNKLGLKLLHIVKKTMRLHLSVDDFSHYINCFIRNDVVVNEASALLLAPSCAYSNLHVPRTTEYIDFLIEIGHQSTTPSVSNNNVLARTLNDDIPHIILGNGATTAKRETSFINILVSGNDLSIYSSGTITFGIWLRLADCSNNNSCIPLLALCTNSAGGCFVEAYYDIKESNVRVIWKKGSAVTTINYKKNDPLTLREWTLFTLQFKKARTISPSFKVFSYINGLRGEPLNSDSMDIDIPLGTHSLTHSLTHSTHSLTHSLTHLGTEQIVEFVVGKLFLCQQVPQRNSSSDGSTSSMDPDNIPVWHLGALSVFDELVNANQGTATNPPNHSLTHSLTHSLIKLDCCI